MKTEGTSIMDNLEIKEEDRQAQHKKRNNMNNADTPIHWGLSDVPEKGEQFFLLLTPTSVNRLIFQYTKSSTTYILHGLNKP